MLGTLLIALVALKTEVKVTLGAAVQHVDDSAVAAVARAPHHSRRYGCTEDMAFGARTLSTRSSSLSVYAVAADIPVALLAAVPRLPPSNLSFARIARDRVCICRRSIAPSHLAQCVTQGTSKRSRMCKRSKLHRLHERRSAPMGAVSAHRTLRTQTPLFLLQKGSADGLRARFLHLDPSTLASSHPSACTITAHKIVRLGVNIPIFRGSRRHLRVAPRIKELRKGLPGRLFSSLSNERLPHQMVTCARKPALRSTAADYMACGTLETV